MFFHRLQQRSLRLRWRAVDFIGQHQVGKDRALDETETAYARLLVFFDHIGSDDIAGHEIGRELHAIETQIENLRKRAHHQRLRQSRHADHQAVTAAEERHENLVDDFFLTDYDFAHLRLKSVAAFTQRFNDGEVIASRGGRFSQCDRFLVGGICKGHALLRGTSYSKVWICERLYRWRGRSGQMEDVIRDFREGHSIRWRWMSFSKSESRITEVRITFISQTAQFAQPRDRPLKRVQRLAQFRLAVRGADPRLAARRKINAFQKQRAA